MQSASAVQPTGHLSSHLPVRLQVWLPVQNDPSKGRYFTDPQRRAFYDRAQAAVAQVPGVRISEIGGDEPDRIGGYARCACSRPNGGS